MIVGTFEAIADWAKATIEDVGESGQVWTYRRKIRTIAQLVEDFGTGEQNASGDEITRGWMIDVNQSDIVQPAHGGSYYLFNISYIFLQSLEGRGEDKHEITAYIETVVNALQAEPKPAALAAYTSSGVPSVYPVTINEIYTVQFPFTGESAGRLHYRVDMTQPIRLSQPIRS